MDVALDNTESGLDSDCIDEEIEHQLYSSIFFECPSVDESTSLENGPGTSKSKPDSSQTWDPVVCCVTSQCSVSTITETSVRATVSSFQDDSSSASDDFLACNPVSFTSESSTKSSDVDLFEDNYSEVPHMPQLNSGHLGVNENHIAIGNTPRSNPSFKGLSEVDCFLGSKSDDPKLWTIDPADYCSSSAKNRDSRYFKEDFDICSKCRNRGHISSKCPNHDPVCIFCGELGHLKDKCPSVYCFACLSPGHSKKQCDLLEHLKRCTCTRCGLKGHESHLCTELWRQYKTTTRVGKPIPIPHKIFLQRQACCNCGRRGHTIDECRRQFFRSNFIGPPPRRRVLVYDRNNIYKKKALKSLFVSERKRFRRLAKKRFTVEAEVSASSDFTDLTIEVNNRLLHQIKEQATNDQGATSVDNSMATKGCNEQLSLTPLERIKSRRSSSTNEDSFLPLNPQGQVDSVFRKAQCCRKSYRDSRNRPKPFFAFHWKLDQINQDPLCSAEATSLSYGTATESNITDRSPLRKRGKCKSVPMQSSSDKKKKNRCLGDSAEMRPAISVKNIDEECPTNHISCDGTRKRKKVQRRFGEPVAEKVKPCKSNHFNDNQWLRFIRSSPKIDPWESTRQTTQLNRKAKRKVKKSHSNSKLLECLISR